MNHDLRFTIGRWLWLLAISYLLSPISSEAQPVPPTTSFTRWLLSSTNQAQFLERSGASTNSSSSTNGGVVAASTSITVDTNGGVFTPKLAPAVSNQWALDAAEAAKNATNTIRAEALVGTIDDARLPASISSDITGSAATVTSVAGNAAQIIPITRTNGVALVYDAKGYGAAGNNSTDDTLVLSNIVKLANWTSAAAVGEAYIPKGVYLIRNEILAGGTVGNSSIPNANWQAGYSAIRGSRDAMIRLDANTNAMRTLNGMRMLTISDLIFLGTNYNGAASNNLHNGLVLDGPGGHLTVRDVMTHSFNAGIVLQDITDCDLQNIWCASNFVGLATEYKPDNVRISGRFEGNRYGVMNHWTNLTYATRNTAGQLLVVGAFGYNYVGVFVSGGHVRVGPAYFEGNTHAAIQIGLNSADTYEASYVQGDVDAPTVLIDSFDANQNSNDIEVYTSSTIQFINAKRMEVIDGGVPIRLRSASADLSTIGGDARLTVINSSGVTFSVPAFWKYSAGVLYPNYGNVTNQYDGSGLTNIPYAALNVTSNRMDRWLDATNGLDSNPGTFAQPWKTIGYAVSNATAGMNLKLAAGFYNASTNTLSLPHNVNLYGPATIISAVDLNYDGVAINPGNNSIISDITIQCDTNYIYTAFAGGSHSGYFAGTGVGLTSHLANNKSFTNATWINVKIKDATTDGFYFYSRTNNPSSGVAYNCEALAFSDGVAGEYNSGTGLHTNTAITFIGCKIDAAYNPANDDITFGSGSIAHLARGKFKFIGCTGTGSGLANGANGQISATSGASVEIVGGSLVSDTLPFHVNPDSRMSGFTTANGTNFALSTVIGNASGLTNLQATNIVGTANRVLGFGASGVGTNLPTTGSGAVVLSNSPNIHISNLYVGAAGLFTVGGNGEIAIINGAGDLRIGGPRGIWTFYDNSVSIGASDRRWIWVYANNIQASNAVTYLQSSLFPTSSIPVGSTTVTNLAQVPWRGYLVTVATNHSVGGWMWQTNGPSGVPVWGAFNPASQP